MSAGPRPSPARSLHPSLGDYEQPAPGVLVVSATRWADFRACPRRYFLRWVIGIPGTFVHADGDESSPGASDRETRALVGLAVHAELHARHCDGLARHGDAGHLVDAAVLEGDTVLDAVVAHDAICPAAEGARYLGGELDLRWFHARKATLVSGRVDAVWEWPDSTIEIRDYKTGNVRSELRTDLAAALYGLLGLANFPARPVRISYEYLGRGRADVVSLDVDPAAVADLVGDVERFADEVRREAVFAPTPSSTHCPHCPYRLTCPAVG